MPRNTSGTYTLPTGNPVQYGTVIDPAWANSTNTDLAAALSDSLSRSGKGAMRAVLNMGGFKVAGAAGATLSSDLPTALQVRSGTFTWLFPVSSDASGNAYTGTSPLPDAPVGGTVFSFATDKANTGAVTLSVNGGAPLPVLVNGAAMIAGMLAAGSVVQVVLFGNSYRMIGGVGSATNGLNDAMSTVPAVLDVTLASNALTLEPKVNVPNGMLQLDENGDVPSIYWPTTPQHFLGMWNAVPGIVPPDGTNNGDFYIVSLQGTLLIYRSSVYPNFTPQNTNCLVGTRLIWNTAGTVTQPVGWYYAGPIAANMASQVSNIATSLFPAALNVQAWLDAMDAYAADLLPTTGGALTGDVTQSAAPAGATSLVTMQYVLDAVAAINTGILSFMGRTAAAAVLESADVIAALGYTPANVGGETFGGPISAPVVGATAFVPLPLSANIAGVQNIDFLAGQTQLLTLTATASIAAINNFPAGSLLRLTFFNTNLIISAWPASVKWPGAGTPPDLTTGTLKKAIVVIENDGTDLLANAAVY